MITVAIERNNFVYVYNGNDVIFSCPGNLYGYTAYTVSVIRMGRIYSYDIETKEIISNQPLK